MPVSFLTNRGRERLDHLGFRRGTEEELLGLTTRLLERALEHDRPTFLFQLASERLHRDKIVRPGVTRLEKIVPLRALRPVRPPTVVCNHS